MEIISTLNGDYTIILEGKPFRLWSTENSFKKICKMTFINNLGITILELTTTELDMENILSCLGNFMEFGMWQDVVYINENNSQLRRYIIDIEDRNFYNYRSDTVWNIFLGINQIDPIGGMANLITIEFNDDKLTEFMYKLYHEFIEDLEGIHYNIDFLL